MNFFTVRFTRVENTSGYKIEVSETRGEIRFLIRQEIQNETNKFNET